MENTMLNGSANNCQWPEEVGIIAMEIYFPRLCVSQQQLEVYDEVSAGKYTIGLGQDIMGFCTDREDINSLCLTATKRLLEKYNIDPKEIGRIEVGTETIVDKSKSVKTSLMQLFEDSGNRSIEGIDTTNACFGGTQALFNAVDWVESSSWDGRYAVVVMGDIAVYAKGPARCTGGAGAVAMLIGPNAALVMERGLRSVHCSHAYDFYKPQMTSEYPTVDGKKSVESYLSALDACYARYCDKYGKISAYDFYKPQMTSEYPTVDGKKSVESYLSALDACYARYCDKYGKISGEDMSLGSFDAMVFHSPYTKLVQKSLARLTYLDFLQNKHVLDHEASDPAVVQTMDNSRKVSLDSTYFDRDLEKAYMAYSKKTFQKKTAPSLDIAKKMGNMYTPSLYGCLISFLLSKSMEELPGSRVGMFSFGSGFMAALFSVKVNPNAQSALAALYGELASCKKMLEKRTEQSPDFFTNALLERESLMKSAPYTPQADIETCLFPGTFYLDHIDEKHRRHYKRHGATDSAVINGC